MTLCWLRINIKKFKSISVYSVTPLTIKRSGQQNFQDSKSCRQYVIKSGCWQQHLENSTSCWCKIWEIPDPTSNTCKIQNLNGRFGKFQILWARFRKYKILPPKFGKIFKFRLQEWKIQDPDHKMWKISRSFQKITYNLNPWIGFKMLVLALI